MGGGRFGSSINGIFSFLGGEVGGEGKVISGADTALFFSPYC